TLNNSPLRLSHAISPLTPYRAAATPSHHPRLALLRRRRPCLPSSPPAPPPHRAGPASPVAPAGPAPSPSPDPPPRRPPRLNLCRRHSPLLHLARLSGVRLGGGSNGEQSSLPVWLMAAAAPPPTHPPSLETEDRSGERACDCCCRTCASTHSASARTRHSSALPVCPISSSQVITSLDGA
ncbi:hypothetical protein BRADI_3g18023v3, partial [Brachypodium distachyon]